MEEEEAYVLGKGAGLYVWREVGIGCVGFYFPPPFSVLISLSNNRLICAYVFYQCIYPRISVTGRQGIYFTVV